MNRTRPAFVPPLVAVLLAPLALLASVVAAPPATSAEECLNRTATLVGPGEGGVLVGTAGDDVIVTDGATDVEALGGDDVVCLTGTDADVTVDAGAGADVVTAYTYDDPPPDARSTAARRAAPVATIVLGPGDDRGRFVTDDAGGRLGDEEDAGAVTDFVVDGGTGVDQLYLDSWYQVDKDEPLDGDVHLDVARGTATLGGAVTVAFSAVDRYRVETAGTATLLGTAGPDTLVGVGCGGTVVKAGPGGDAITVLDPPTDDDEYWCSTTRPGPYRIYGGQHGDRITVQTDAVVLGGSGADVIDARPSCRIFAFYDTCTGRLYGEDGNDTLYGGPGARGDGVEVLDGGLGNDVLYGLGGPDRLAGQGGNDRLFGGTGRDSAHGGTGWDLCRAEVRRGCERR